MHNATDRRNRDKARHLGRKAARRNKRATVAFFGGLA